MAKKKKETSTLGIVVLWTFVLALTFSAGLITGQRLQRRDALPPLASIRAVPMAEKQAPLKTEFSFYKTLTKPEQVRPIAKDKGASKKVHPTKIVKREVSEKKPKIEKKNSDLEKIVSKVKTEVKKIGKLKEQLPAKYTLQLSSHPTKAQADRAVEKLKKQGYEVHLVSISIPDRGRVFRVRVGKFQSMDEARNFQGRIKSKNGISSFVTPL